MRWPSEGEGADGGRGRATTLKSATLLILGSSSLNAKAVEGKLESLLLRVVEVDFTKQGSKPTVSMKVLCQRTRDQQVCITPPGASPWLHNAQGAAS